MCYNNCNNIRSIITLYLNKNKINKINILSLSYKALWVGSVSVVRDYSKGFEYFMLMGVLEAWRWGGGELGRGLGRIRRTCLRFEKDVSVILYESVGVCEGRVLFYSVSRMDPNFNFIKRIFYFFLFTVCLICQGKLRWGCINVID